MSEQPSTPRVLVVDDDEAVRTFVTRALQEAGYEVMSAAGGRDALKVVDAQPRFDVCVVDVMMPDITGDELGCLLRARDPDAKILYFTGFSDRLFTERPLLAAHEAYLDKPVTISGLQEAVSLLLFGHTRKNGSRRQSRDR